MCFPKTPKPTPVPKELPKPEAVAEPDEIGVARAAEDDSLFGGIPDLRVDRSLTGGGAGASGSGLNME